MLPSPLMHALNVRDGGGGGDRCIETIEAPKASCPTQVPQHV